MEQMDQLGEWVRNYSDRLRYIAYTYVRDFNRSEDIVQEAMVQAYLSIRQLRDPERPYPWLVRIVINLCLNANRKYQREQPTDLLPEQRGKSTEDIYMESSRDKEVYAAITGLDEHYRTPIILYYFEDLSVREIAYALRLSEGAVKTRLARGREQLKSELTRERENELGNTHPSSQANLFTR